VRTNEKSQIGLKTLRPTKNADERKKPDRLKNASPHQKGVWTNEKSQIGQKTIRTTKKE
jgi:hypothetical protein